MPLNYKDFEWKEKEFLKMGTQVLNEALKKILLGNK